MSHHYPLLPSATKLRQGNVVTPVCHSVHPGVGVCLIACWDTPPADTPWADDLPRQTPSGQWPPRAVTLLPRRSLQRTVCILLDSDPDSDLDSKPDGYIVLCRNIHIGSDLDSDLCTESFPNHYCTQFRDRYLSWGQISIPIPYISIRGSESGSEPMSNFCIVQKSESE